MHCTHSIVGQKSIRTLNYIIEHSYPHLYLRCALHFEVRLSKLLQKRSYEYLLECPNTFVNSVVNCIQEYILISPLYNRTLMFFLLEEGHSCLLEFSKLLRRLPEQKIKLTKELVNRITINEVYIRIFLINTFSNSVFRTHLFNCRQTKMSLDYSDDLLEHVHRDIPPPEVGRISLVKGDYEYWHYGCDGFNDKGWGCGYRTLQTLCSWVIKNKKLHERVPSIRRIQEVLVTLEDKEQTFVGSREWIGSFEVCLVLNHLYDVLSKIVHVSNGRLLRDHIPVIRKHFHEFGSPIMMGGDQDCSSKCVVGIHEGEEKAYLLIVDPHFVGRPKNGEQLQNQCWVKWQNLDDFVDSSFYNLCLPQIKHVDAMSDDDK